MKTPDVPNTSLIDILKEEPEFKADPNIKPETSDFQEPVQTEQPITTEPPKTEPNPTDFEPPQAQPNPLFEPPQRKVKPRLSEKEYEESAEMTIMLFDGTQTLILPYLYQKSIFTREETRKLKELNERYKKPEVDLSEEDQKLLAKYHDYKELSDNVPFTEQEIELLKNPLAKVYSKYNIHVGPELLLLGAVTTVIVPRLLPLFSRLERL